MFETKPVAGGPDVAKSTIAGNLSTTANLTQIRVQQAFFARSLGAAKNKESKAKKDAQ